MNKNRRYRPPIDQPTKDRVVALLRSGLSTIQASDRTGVGQSTAAQIARQAGLVFSKPGSNTGQWIDSQEHTTMSGQSSDEWNMALDDYTALFPPEREQETNAEAPHQDQVDDETDEAERAPEWSVMAQLTNDDDLQAAARLLNQASDRRLQDKQLIADLEARIDDMMLRLGAAALEAQNGYDKYERQIVQLETENKRLNEQIKVEISRGFLRQSMDNLRSALG